MGTGLIVLVAGAVFAVAQGQPMDLSEILAPPPSADYSDAGGPNILNGPVDAHSYAVWLGSNAASIKSIENTLRAEGFKRGYARTWVQTPHEAHDIGSNHQQWLIETVEEFRSETAAQNRFQGTKQYTEQQHRFERAIEPAIPDSYGAVIDQGYTTDFLIGFRKGNDVYFVQLESWINDMTALVNAQAKAQFALAPDYTIAPDQWADPTGRAGDRMTSATAVPRWVLPAAAGAIALVMVLTIGSAIALAAFTRRMRLASTEGRALQMSPDGAHWWDGGRWRDARVDVPPTAQRSPDGTYWWDGLSWRRSPSGPTGPSP